MEQRFDIHVVFRNKRVKQGFRGTQLETMKSCDFLFLALLGIVAVYYDNLLACLNQSWNVVLRGFCHFVLDTDSQECDPEALKSVLIRCHCSQDNACMTVVCISYF